jgi:F-type H+-transporting ATPase subunit delta
MTEPLSVARPYAKAAFNYALKAKKIEDWEAFLKLLAMVTKQERVRNWLSQPHLSVKGKITALRVIVGDDNWLAGGANFLAQLLQRQRLNVLVELLYLFKQYHSEYERRKPVSVTSAYPLNDAQSEQLVKILEMKLGQAVEMHQVVDSSLLGGVVIQTGDMVLDYTVKGRLNRLVDAVS